MLLTQLNVSHSSSLEHLNARKEMIQLLNDLYHIESTAVSERQELIAFGRFLHFIYCSNRRQ